MKMIFGVDSSIPANTRLSNGYQLYDWVMRMNCCPAFWARTISGFNRLTADEVDFLHSKNCKAALIFDDLTEASVSTNSGIDDALRAIDAANAIGVPTGNGIAIFALIREDWSINHNWMISYADTLIANGYAPGFIGNTDSSKNFNFDRQCSHYVEFLGEAAHDNIAYWATEPKPVDEPTVWAPYCPSAMTPEQIDIWSSGSKIGFQDITVNVNYAHDPSELRFMW